MRIRPITPSRRQYRAAQGIAELIAAIPPGLDRDVEIALAASFGYWPGMQDQVIAACGVAARTAAPT